MCDLSEWIQQHIFWCICIFFAASHFKFFFKTHPCDLVYTMKPDGTEITRISQVHGRCTCSFVLPGDKEILYSQTLSGQQTCPPTPDFTAGYLWPIYKDMDIYVGEAGGKVLRSISPSDAYDAESTLSPDGKTIVFTSARSGDLELYLIDTDGKNLRRVTYSPGYDGGMFSSSSLFFDCSLCFNDRSVFFPRRNETHMESWSSNRNQLG